MNWPQGVGRVILQRVGSTSEEAMVRAADAAPIWVMAHEQTAARGRRGRPWAMPPGNFAASLAWRPGGTANEHAQRSFVASLALVEALESLGVAGLSVKWPNDVLLHGGKLAGILLESPRPDLLVLGIGVNLVAAPDAGQLEPTATRPAALDGRITPVALLDILAPTFQAREAEMQAHGFAPIRKAWLARAAGLGQAITARMMTQTLEGRFEDIDAEGQLVLITTDGRHTLPAADIYFGDPTCS